MTHWPTVAQALFAQIDTIVDSRARVLNAISTKGACLFDVGPESVGSLGFAYHEWYDGPDPAECAVGEVHLCHFRDSAVAPASDFERFVSAWPWPRG